MRKSSLLLAGVGAVLLVACSGDKKVAINDDLKNDLALASSDDGITLANASPNTGQQVISAIERTTPPARQTAPSTRVRKHKAAPKSPPHVVKTQAPATVAQTEEQSVSPEPVANDPTPVSPRPQPVAVSYPSGPSSGGDNGSVSRGSSAGAVIGTILGAVIRGGIVIGDGDACDPRTDAAKSSLPNGHPFPRWNGKSWDCTPKNADALLAKAGDAAQTDRIPFFLLSRLTHDDKHLHEARYSGRPGFHARLGRLQTGR